MDKRIFNKALDRIRTTCYNTPKSITTPLTEPTMFKKIATLALSLALTLSAFAQDKKTPLQIENARYAAALEEATKKVNAAHVVKLKELQAKAMKAGDLDAALEIRDEIKRVEGEAKEEAKTAELPKVAGTVWGWDTATLTFSANGTVVKAFADITYRGKWKQLKDGKVYCVFLTGDKKVQMWAIFNEGKSIQMEENGARVFAVWNKVEPKKTETK